MLNQKIADLQQKQRRNTARMYDENETNEVREKAKALAKEQKSLIRNTERELKDLIELLEKTHIGSTSGSSS